MKILLVEDNNILAKGLIYSLEQKQYNVVHKLNIQETINYLIYNRPSLIILDISLPDGNGFELYTQKIKPQKIPTIFLTAKDSVTDKVKGLKLGAEDYIVKPFESMELLARIEVVFRRAGKSSDIFEYKDVKVDFAKREVFRNNKNVEMTAQEFELLKVLIQNKNLALSREKLLESAWGYDYYGDTRTVDMHIQRLRKKLGWDDIIVTVYKYGYRLEINV